MSVSLSPSCLSLSLPRVCLSLSLVSLSPSCLSHSLSLVSLSRGLSLVVSLSRLSRLVSSRLVSRLSLALSLSRLVSLVPLSLVSSLSCLSLVSLAFSLVSLARVSLVSFQSEYHCHVFVERVCGEASLGLFSAATVSHVVLSICEFERSAHSTAQQYAVTVAGQTTVRPSWQRKKLGSVPTYLSLCENGAIHDTLTVNALQEAPRTTEKKKRLDMSEPWTDNAELDTCTTKTQTVMLFPWQLEYSQLQSTPHFGKKHAFADKGQPSKWRELATQFELSQLHAHETQLDATWHSRTHFSKKIVSFHSEMCSSSTPSESGPQLFSS